MTTVWDEVGADCFRRRYESFDLNIGVVRGSDGFFVIDTRCHAAEARELLDELRELGSMPVRRILNSHWHFDHCWGNATMRAASPGVEIWGHPRLAALHAKYTEDTKAMVRGLHPEWSELVDEVEVVPPDHLVADAVTIDLGNRGIDIRFPGRGHTDNDLVVVVHDADVVFAGDIVEESAPPSYGDDCFPLDWPATNTQLLDWISPTATVVPGHGDVIDRAFVVEQTDAVTRVATAIREGYANGLGIDEVIATGDWPFPAVRMRNAVARGYGALRRS